MWCSLASLTEKQAALVVSHDWIAQRLMHQYRMRDQFMMSAEDVLQIARVGLILAAKRYDPSRGPFSSLAWRYAAGEVSHAFRKCRMIPQRKYPHTAYYTILRFDEDTPLPAEEDPALAHAEDRADLRDLIQRRLPKGQQRILGLTLCGWGQDAIAKRVGGVIQTQVGRDLRRSVKVLKGEPVLRPEGWEKRYAS